MGDNAPAVDATAARVMGIDPARVDYLAMAQKIKLGSLRREDIAVAAGKDRKVPDRLRPGRRIRVPESPERLTFGSKEESHET